MAVALILIFVAIAAVTYGLWLSSEEPPPLDSDPGERLRAAAELYRIQRQLDTAQLKNQQRRGARRLRRDISEALDKDDGQP